MDKTKIDRINELAHKSKAEGLTDTEKEEQRLLRKEFLAEIRADIKASLESIEFVEESEQTVEKSESTPEFETSADSKNPVENGEVTPDMMIKFITEKLKSMAKNGNKETAKQFMRDHKLPNVSALSSLAISRLETVYHDVAKI